MYQAQEFPQITPMEIDILFQLVALRHQTGYVIVQFIPFQINGLFHKAIYNKVRMVHCTY